MELDKVQDKAENRSVEAMSIPIPDVDGQIGEKDHMKYEFVINYAEEDIQSTLQEIFPETSVTIKYLK
jgi:hypothetical protein